MQWVPYGAPESEFKEHIRTFASVFPHVSVIKGAGGYGAYMLGSEEPIVVRAGRHPRGPLAAGRSSRTSRPRTTRPATTVDAWIAVIARQRWLDDDDGQGLRRRRPLITDDHPRPEYFLLRRLADGIPDQ